MPTIFTRTAVPLAIGLGLGSRPQGEREGMEQAPMAFNVRVGVWIVWLPATASCLSLWIARRVSLSSRTRSASAPR